MNNYRTSILISLSLSFLLGAAIEARAQTEDVCNNDSWSNCGVAVKRELERRPEDVREIIRLAGLWGTAFEREYSSLRARGRLERSTPDAEKIRQKIAAKLDPLEIAKDKAIDAIVKKYLPRLAPVLAFTGSTMGTALDAFLTPSDTATDFDELRNMNDEMQDLIAELLRPHLKSDWKERLGDAVQAARPGLSSPK